MNDTTQSSLPADDAANGVEPAAPRILARQLARPLTSDEIDHIVGGVTAGVAVAHVVGAGMIVPIGDAD